MNRRELTYPAGLNHPFLALLATKNFLSPDLRENLLEATEVTLDDNKQGYVLTFAEHGRIPLSDSIRVYDTDGNEVDMFPQEARNLVANGTPVYRNEDVLGEDYQSIEWREGCGYEQPEI